MPEKVVKVRDIMVTSMHIIDGLSTVEEAIEQMHRLSVSSLIIDRRNGDDEYGIVTVRHIAAKVIGQNRPPARTSVYEIMTKPALTVSAEMNAKYAIRLLARLGRSRALVTQDSELIGLVTLRDLVVGYAVGQEDQEQQAPAGG